MILIVELEARTLGHITERPRTETRPGRQEGRQAGIQFDHALVPSYNRAAHTTKPQRGRLLDRCDFTKLMPHLPHDIEHVSCARHNNAQIIN